MNEIILLKKILPLKSFGLTRSVDCIIGGNWVLVLFFEAFSDPVFSTLKQIIIKSEN